MESKIQSIEDAFNYTGRDIKNLPIVDHLPEEDREYQIASYKWQVIIAALNKEANAGVKFWPNWNDPNEYKYSPVAIVKASKEQPAGFGFSRTSYVYSCTIAYVGSRLSFLNGERTLYAMKQFPEIFKTLFLG